MVAERLDEYTEAEAGCSWGRDGTVGVSMLLRRPNCLICRNDEERWDDGWERAKELHERWNKRDSSSVTA